MDELYKFIGTGLGKLIVAGGIILVTALNNVAKKWKLQSRLKSNKLKRDMANIAKIAVDDLIRSIQVITRANRVNLWQYSNGSKDLNNVCFEYVTCTSEKTDRTTSGIANQFQMQILDAYMRKIVSRISDCQEDYLLIDIDEEKYDDRIAMEEYGNSSGYHFKIFKDNVWKGIVTITFIERTSLSADTLHEVLVMMASIKRLHEKMVY